MFRLETRNAADPVSRPADIIVVWTECRSLQIKTRTAYSIRTFHGRSDFMFCPLKITFGQPRCFYFSIHAQNRFQGKLVCTVSCVCNSFIPFNLHVIE